MTTDLKIERNEQGIYDFSIDENGDLANGNFLDSSLLYTVYGERRATASEVIVAEKRRGWIGSENKDFENGSKLWFFEQSRITRSILNQIQSKAINAFQYLIDDGLASDIVVNVTKTKSSVLLEVNIFVSPSEVETRLFELWKNTGM